MTPKQDEIEALARVMFEAQEGGVVKYPLPGLVIGEDQAGKYFPLAAAILAAGYSRTADTRAALLVWAAREAEDNCMGDECDASFQGLANTFRKKAAAIRAGKGE